MWGKILLVLGILGILGVLVYFIVKFIVLIVVLVGVGIWAYFELRGTNHRKGRRIRGSDKRFGGIRSKDKDTGNGYVRSPKAIVNNRMALTSFRESKGAASPDQEDTLQNGAQDELDLRRRYPPKLRARDGHPVRSRGEQLIDGSLDSMGIPHDCEKRYPVEEKLFCDFYIEQGDKKVYIEFWGLKSQQYLEQKHKKQEVCKNHGLQLIEITDKDIKDISNLDDLLARKLRGCGIEIGTRKKGYCIRCGQAIEFDTKHPYCGECYAVWAEYKRRGYTSYTERFCHQCAEGNEGSKYRPLCRRCY